MIAHAQTLKGANQTWPDDDVRTSFFSKFTNVLLSTQLALTFSVNELKTDAWWETHFPAIYQAMASQNPAAFQFHAAFFRNLSMNSCFHFTFSVAESSVRQIALAVLNYKNLNFNRVYKKLFNDLSVPNEIEAFDFIRHVRNTIHNNGFHTAPDALVMYRGVNYAFVEGDRPAFVDWSVLAACLEDIGNSMYELALIPRVAAVSAIKDVHDHAV